jgi:predicted P-loop ATPase
VEIGADVTCPLDLEGLIRDRDRLWGAAVRLWLAGFDFRIPPPQILAAISSQQATLNAGDPWLSEISAHLSKWRHATISVREVHDLLELPRKERTARSSGRIRRSLDDLGWKPLGPAHSIDRRRHTNRDTVYSRGGQEATITDIKLGPVEK